MNNDWKKIDQKQLQKAIVKLFKIIHKPGIDHIGLEIEVYETNKWYKRYSIIARELYKLL
jgi:hypothetical protein